MTPFFVLYVLPLCIELVVLGLAFSTNHVRPRQLPAGLFWCCMPGLNLLLAIVSVLTLISSLLGGD